MRDVRYAPDRDEIICNDCMNFAPVPCYPEEPCGCSRCEWMRVRLDDMHASV